MIEACSFGSMTIDGRTYTTDLLIFPDGRVADAWWRAEGHRFTHPDIEELMLAQPDILVAGTGVYGRVKIDSELRRVLFQAAIELVAVRNKKAIRAFNLALQKGRRVAGCFHLTC